MKVHRSAIADIDPHVLYEIMRLRNDVFVVEQECAYRDLDGRDSERDAMLLWIDDDAGAIAATARVLHEREERWRIGRVCTRADTRRRGLGSALMRAGIDAASSAGAREIVLDAQAQQARWYAHFGFASTGREFVEDGIPHVEMLHA